MFPGTLKSMGPLVGEDPSIMVKGKEGIETPGPIAETENGKGTPDGMELLA
jgi:hypothetical protein